MATEKQNKDFLNELEVQWLLDDAIDSINNNLDPEDVFDEKTLEDWAIENNFRKDDCP